MGTLVNGLNNVYGTILEAVSEFPEMQVVLSVGRNFNPSDLGPTPSNTIVVRIAPQIELLKRAALCITHAGLNTALEALAQGVPMVAIPIGYDQPGVAARIAYHGVGEFVEIGYLSAHRLSELIVMVLENPNYRDKARWFQKVLGETRGLDVAADIIERVFCTTSRVYLASIEAILVELTVAIRFLHRRDAGFSSVSFLWHQRVNPYGDPRQIFYCHF